MKELDKTISKMTAEGVTELTIRQGEALEVGNPRNLLLTGNIDAPSRFAEARDMDLKTSHCFYSVTKGSIDLYTNELDPYGRFHIEGQLKVSSKFEDLGINLGNTYNPFQLAQKLKMQRSIFPSRDEHTKICTTLRNFEAKVKKVLEEKVEDKGDYTYSRQQAVDSNLPASFQLHIPLIEGEPKQTIVVTTVVTVHGNDIHCCLESVEGAEYIEGAFEKRVLEEVEKLTGKTTLIAR